MTKIKEGDFVELDYTGKLKDTGDIFDTTNKEIAQKAGIDTSQGHFHPIIAKVGSKIVLKGMDEALVGKEPGKFTLDIPAELAFGKKDPKKIQLIATSKFLKQKIKPQRGLQLNIDGHIGTVRSVTGGRTIVDFNHPLSGKELTYDVEIKRIVTDKKEQCKAAFGWMQFMPKEWDVKGNVCTIKVDKEVPEDVVKAVSEQLKKFTGCELKFELRKGSKTED